MSDAAEAATWKAPKKNGLHNSEAIATFKGRQTIITASHNFYRDWQGGTGPPAVAALATEKSVQFAGLTGTQAALNTSRSLSPQRSDISSMISKSAQLAAAASQQQQQLQPLEPLCASDTGAPRQRSLKTKQTDACSTSSDVQEGRRSRMSSNSSSQERKSRLVSSGSAPALAQLSALQHQGSSRGVPTALSVVGTAAQLVNQGSSSRSAGGAAGSRKSSSSAVPTGASPVKTTSSSSRHPSISVSPASRRASATGSKASSPTARSKASCLAQTAPAAMLEAAIAAAALVAAAAAAAVVDAPLASSTSSCSVPAAAEAAAERYSVGGTVATDLETAAAKLSPRGQLKLPDVATSPQRPSSRCGGSVSPRLPVVSSASTSSATSSSRTAAP